GEGQGEDFASVGIGVAEVVLAHPGERLAHRAEPGGTGEAGQVGDAGAEIVPRRGNWIRTSSDGRLTWAGAARDPGPGAGLELQVALAGQLGVGVHHDGA